MTNSSIALDFDLLIKLIIYVFLPMLGIILLSRLVVALCCRKTKKENPNRYQHILSYWSSFVAISTTIVLLAITVIYTFNFTKTMTAKGLVEKYKIIYYLMLFFPIIPFGFLIYYIIELVTIEKRVKRQNTMALEEEISADKKENKDKKLVDNSQDSENSEETPSKEEDIEIL